MIHEVMPAIVQELNRFLKMKHNITEEKAVMSHIVNADGSIALQEPDKIVVTLTNIEMDRSKSNTATYEQTPRGSFTKVNPPVNVNLYLLFSAYFTNENYTEGLKFISSVIAFFQNRSGIFTVHNTPGLSNVAGVVEKFTAELLPLEYRDVSNVWSGLGAKYLPSVLYRLRTLPIEHRDPQPEIPAIKKV
jgi:hypothetical protein